MATISDVAKLSGISVSTVSRVINDSPHVSPDKRQRVLDAMEQLGYSPMQAARQMRGSGSQNIAVVVPTITNTFFAYLVNAIERTCRERDYKTLIIQTRGEKKLELEALNLLKLHHVDGVILCAIENEWPLIQSYTKYGRIVVCNEYNDDDSVSMIRGKQYEGFYEATKYLMRKGYRKTAYCTGAKAIVLQPVGLNIDSDRYRGFAECLSDNGAVTHPNWMFTDIHTFDDGQHVFREIMAMKDRPEVIIAGSDQVAVGMVLEAGRMGVKIPEEMAVMGVDDQPLAVQIEIPLTTIHQPVDEEGQAAASEMIRQLEGVSTNTIKQTLDLTLAVRESA